MKFISKSSNLLVILRPGLSAQPLTGTPARPAISVRFKDGVAEVPDGELTEMMLRHPGFNGDFIAAGKIGIPDPYAYTRQTSEPQHQVTEMKFGTPVGRKLSEGTPALSLEMRKIIQDMAVAMAKEMLPAMVETTLKSIVETHSNIDADKNEEEEEDQEEEGGESIPTKRKFKKRSKIKSAKKLKMKKKNPVTENGSIEDVTGSDNTVSETPATADIQITENIPATEDIHTEDIYTKEEF